MSNISLWDDVRKIECYATLTQRADIYRRFFSRSLIYGSLVTPRKETRVKWRLMWRYNSIVKSVPPSNLGNNNNLALRSFAQLRIPRSEYAHKSLSPAKIMEMNCFSKKISTSSDSVNSMYDHESPKATRREVHFTILS